MLTKVVVAIIACCSMLQAQEASLPEPQYGHQYNAVVNGQPVVLERQTAFTDTRHQRFFALTPSTTVYQSINNPASPIRVGPNTHFIVRLETGDRDPQTLIHLQKLTPGKKDRQVPIITYKVSMIPFGGVNHKRAPDEPVPVTIQKYGAGLLEIIPTQPLEAGEYAFMTGHEAQCFGVDAGAANTSTAAPTAAPKSQPEVWRLKPLQHPQAITDIYEATLNGTSEAGGKRGAAQLDVSCTVNRFDGPSGTEASASAILKVRREMVAFPTDALSCQGDGAAGAPFLRSQLGTGQEQTRNLCFDEDLGTDPRTILSFGLSYEEPLISSILQASNEPLILKIRPRDDGPDAMTSIFQLPANGSEVLAAFDPCLKIGEAKRKKEADAIVVACPDLSGKTLSDVNVLVGSAMRKLPPDPENDIGAAWDMPKPTKAHPVVPKLTLACLYRDGTTVAETSTSATKPVSPITDKKLLPIPATAKFCAFREDSTTNAPYGNCSRE